MALDVNNSKRFTVYSLHMHTAIRAILSLSLLSLHEIWLIYACCQQNYRRQNHSNRFNWNIYLIAFYLWATVGSIKIFLNTVAITCMLTKFSFIHPPVLFILPNSNKKTGRKNNNGRATLKRDRSGIIVSIHCLTSLVTEQRWIKHSHNKTMQWNNIYLISSMVCQLYSCVHLHLAKCRTEHIDSVNAKRIEEFNFAMHWYLISSIQCYFPSIFLCVLHLTFIQSNFSL